MKKFELIEHTADIGIRAFGNSLAEAFANAGVGLFSIIADLDSVGEGESKKISVEAQDTESLLFEWLNELIYIFDVERMLFKRFDVVKFDDRSIEATGWGEKYNALRHNIKLGVKSATYYKMEIDRQNNTVQVIFDV